MITFKRSWFFFNIPRSPEESFKDAFDDRNTNVQFKGFAPSLNIAFFLFDLKKGLFKYKHDPEATYQRIVFFFR